MKKQILSMLLVLVAFSGMAQRLPNWVYNRPTPSNSTYLYEMESATGTTEMEARNSALALVMRTVAMRIGTPFNLEEVNNALQSGRDYALISAEYDIPIYKVCEYVAKNESPVRVYVLCQAAKTGEINPIWSHFSDCYEDNDKYYATDALYADGFTISQNGKQLRDSEIRTLFANSKSYDLYDKGLRLKNGGKTGAGICGLVGALTLWCQLGWMDYNGNGYWASETGKNFVIYGSVATGACIVGAIVGGIVSSSGKNYIRKAVNLYNNGRMYSQSSMELEYGLTGNGVCVTLSF